MARKKTVPKTASPIPQHHSKTPRVAEEVAPAVKQPRSLGVDHAAIKQRMLVWRFGDVDHKGDWCFENIKPTEVVNMLEKLGTYESMTVGELFQPGSKHGKTYAVEEMPGRGPRRLAELERDDETAISRVALSGKSRLYGFLREHVFYVLWYDPEHEIWPSKLKNT